MSHLHRPTQLCLVSASFLLAVTTLLMVSCSPLKTASSTKETRNSSQDSLQTFTETETRKIKTALGFLEEQIAILSSVRDDARLKKLTKSFFKNQQQSLFDSLESLKNEGSLPQRVTFAALLEAKHDEQLDLLYRLHTGAKGRPENFAIIPPIKDENSLTFFKNARTAAAGESADFSNLITLAIDLRKSGSNGNSQTNSPLSWLLRVLDDPLATQEFGQAINLALFVIVGEQTNQLNKATEWGQRKSDVFKGLFGSAVNLKIADSYFEEFVLKD